MSQDAGSIPAASIFIRVGFSGAFFYRQMLFLSVWDKIEFE